MTRHRSRTRRGYTLVELLMASAASTALIGGLASAMFVASRALDPSQGAAARRTAADRAAAALLSDAQHALRLTERTATALTFAVPDRTGDNQPETLRYAWSGTAGDPLTRSLNGGAALPIASDIRSLTFAADERVINADNVTIPKNVPWPVVQNTQVAVRDTAGTSVAVNRPTGLTAGDLLVASAAVNGNRKDSLAGPSGFTLLERSEEAGTVTQGVWWKVATASEPASYAFNWTGNDRAVAWVIRITNQYPGNPITTFATAGGQSATPNCPAAGSTLDQSLVIRFGAFDDGAITAGVPGLTGHTPILMTTADSRVSGGCGWEVQRRAGDCGSANFTLTASEPFRTVTVVVAPEVN
jgi:hypothetical protein